MIAAFLTLVASHRVVDPTTFIREMSKCSTPIEIVYSGDKTKVYADRLADAIQTRQDYNNKKTLDVKSVAAYEAATHPAADSETVIAILAGEEGNQFTPKIGGLFSNLPVQFDPETCRLQAKMTRVKAGMITWDTVLEGPTADDISGLMDRFLGFSTQNWRDLKLDSQLAVNRVQTSGTNVLQWGPNWGKLPGNVINTVTYADPLLDTSTGDQVYFWDRSNASQVVPAKFKPLVDSIKLAPLTFAAIRQQQSNGHYLALYVTPSDKVMRHMTNKFPTVGSIGDPGFVAQVNDLRSQKRFLTVINGNSADRDVANGVGGILEDSLRNRARLNVLPRGSAPEMTGQDLNSTDMTSRLKSTYGVRWVLVMDLSDAIGTVEYRPEEQCLTNATANYDQAAPSEPSRTPLFGKRMSDDEWAKAQDKYKRDLEDYKVKKARYEYEDQVQWKKMVIKKSVGQVHVSLKLVDLEDNSKIIWFSERTDKFILDEPIRTETENIRGHKNRPRSLECPRPESTAPIAVKNAGGKAISYEIRDLVGESLLPTEDVAVPVAVADFKTIAVESPIITINAGQAQGLKVGDHVVVEIFRDIVDPTTKEIIERVSTDKVTLEVVRVGKTSDCKAVTAKDLALLAKIKVGDVVQVDK